MPVLFHNKSAVNVLIYIFFLLLFVKNIVINIIYQFEDY